MPSRTHSIEALKWLKYLNHINNFENPILHARNGGEVRIENKFVDGFRTDPDTAVSTIYEYFGCFFHGCKYCTDPNSLNPVSKTLMKDLRMATLYRLEKLSKLGYSIVKIWGCDFKQFLEKNEHARKIVEGFKITDPLNPRAALYGGRTNAIQLYAESDENYIIQYSDYISLYPAQMLKNKYPIGHPVIFTEDFGDLNTAHLRYKGLIKCEVLPPKQLFLPILPS